MKRNITTVFNVVAYTVVFTSLIYSTYSLWQAVMPKREHIVVPQEMMALPRLQTEIVTPAFGQECFGCRPSTVAKATSSVHANISCENCHLGVDKHLSEPNTLAFEPTVYFDKEHCGNCHDGHYIETVEYVMKPVVITKEVVKEVPLVKEVLVNHEVPVKLADWESSDELKAFLKEDGTDRHVFLKANDNGTVSFLGQCEDFAIQLRDNAMVKGKYLSITSLSSDEYYKWYGKTLSANTYHAINMARILNEFWYIEPANDRCWKALLLD